MLKCKTVTHLLSDAQDRKLTWMERVQLVLHLAMCSGCGNYKRQMRFLRRATSRHPAGKPKGDGEDSL